MSRQFPHMAWWKTLNLSIVTVFQIMAGIQIVSYNSIAIVHVSWVFAPAFIL